MEETIMAHNIYVNIILSTDEDEFPKDFGMVSEIKKELTLLTLKYPRFKIKRYNFDIIDGEFDMMEENNIEVDPNAE
jgi:hypothetical protein